MGRYAKLEGKRVEAHYRASDIELSVEGALVSDSGKAIFIEERNLHGGRQKTMRMEIPYEYIIRIVETFEQVQANAPASAEPSASVERKRYS
jgi:hypothetical protein